MVKKQHFYTIAKKEMRLAGHFCASFHRSDALYRSSWAYLFLLYTEATLSVVTSSGSRLTRFSSWEWGWVSVRPQWIPSSPTWIDGTQKMVSSTTNSNVTYLWLYHWLSVLTCSTSFPKTTWVKTKCKAPSLHRVLKRCKMGQVQTLLPLHSLNSPCGMTFAFRCIRWQDQHCTSAESLKDFQRGQGRVPSGRDSGKLALSKS